MKTHAFILLILSFISLNSCKNKSNNSDKNNYEVVISTDGDSDNFTVNSDGLLAAVRDSTQYGLTFSDGPNKSMIAKLHRLNYVVNESAKALLLTNVVVDVDTIQIGTSKKMVGTGRQTFDVSLTNITAMIDPGGGQNNGCVGVGCCKLSPSRIICCGECNHPSACEGCGLMEPYTVSGINTTLEINNPDDVPVLNDIFRNYNTLTVKLK